MASVRACGATGGSDGTYIRLVSFISWGVLIHMVSSLFFLFFKLPLLLSLLHTFNLQDEIGLDYDLDHAHAVFTAAAMDDYLLKEGFVRSDWPHRYRRHVR